MVCEGDCRVASNDNPLDSELYTVTRSLLLYGHHQGFAIVLVGHYFTSCLDNLLLTGIMIWGTVAINSDEAKEYETAPEETGLANFLQITTLNSMRIDMFSPTGDKKGNLMIGFLDCAVSHFVPIHVDV